MPVKNEGWRGLLIKAVKFFFTSGMGFILDFTVYTILTQAVGFPVVYANFISSIVGTTFVFIVSTHKIFEKKEGGIPLFLKYVIYVVYQIVLISLMSLVGEFLDGAIHSAFEYELVLKYSKLISKIVITPFTMTCNFFVTRFITEKI